MLKEHMLREDKLAMRAEILETLVTGAGEEVKVKRTLKFAAIDLFVIWTNQLHIC